MSINFSQFPTPTLPINSADFVVGYQNAGTGGVPTLAQYTMLQLAGVLGPLIGPEPPSGPAGGDLSGTYPNPTVSAVHATSGTLNGVTVGATTASTGAFTSLTSTSGALNGTVGATTPNTGAFTALSSTSGALNGTLGATTPNTVAATTISATGTITPAQGPGIAGTTTNNNANTGSVGELLTNATAGTSASSNVALNATSVSLTAGDWDVEGYASYTPAGTTVISAMTQGLSTTSATFGGVNAGNFLQIAGVTQTQGIGGVGATPVQRFSLASTTTVFLVAQAGFTVSTLTVSGFIRARRVR